MSMRYFTLSAVCMLIFCMLLALCGTTDFPGTRQEVVPPSGAVSSAPAPIHSGGGEALASVYPPPWGSEPHPGTGSRGKVGEGVGRNRSLLLLGLVLFAAWVLLSFKLFSNAKN